MKEIFSPKIEIETREEKIDTSVFRKKSNSHSFRGWIIGKIKQAKNEENLDVLFMMKEIYNKYLEFETKARINLRGWKGKSSFEVIKKPDSFEVITYQRKDKYSEPKEIKREISKKEVNLIYESICNILNSRGKNTIIKEKVSSKDIAREYCILSNLNENSYKKPLFDKDGFNYDEFFADRFLHIQTNLILRLLDFYGFINYVGRYVQLLDNRPDIQTILK